MSKSVSTGEALARLISDDEPEPQPQSVEEAENELIYAWQTPDSSLRRIRLAKATTALIRAVNRETK